MKEKFKFNGNIDNSPIEVEDDYDGPIEYNKRQKQIADMFAGFIREDLKDLGVSKPEANLTADIFKENFLNPPDDEDEE